MGQPAPKLGLFASVQRLLGTALDMAQVRLELLSTELELEKQRLFDGLIWGAIGLLALGMGLVLLCGFIILLFWEGYRLAAVGVMALLFLGIAAVFIHEARKRLRHPSGMFDASVEELKRDRAALTGQPHA